jgi:hypothetical protein
MLAPSKMKRERVNAVARHIPPRLITLGSFAESDVRLGHKAVATQMRRAESAVAQPR